MRPNVSKFKVWEEEVSQQGYFSNLIDEQAVFEVYPHAQGFEYIKESAIRYAAQAYPNIGGRKGTLLREFEKQGRVQNVTEDRIRWILYTDGEFYATGIENLEADNVTPGIHNSTFNIKLDVDWYRPNDTLVADYAKEIPVIVKTDPLPDGYGFIYEVQLVTSDKFAFFDPALLEPGLRWLKIGSFIGEAQVNRGSIQFTDAMPYIEFEIPMSGMGWEMTITDKAHTKSKNLRFSALENQGAKRPDMLLNSWEAKFIAQTEFEKDYWLTYGRSAGRDILDGVTERALDIGPGLFEFLEEGNVFDYPLYGGSFEQFSNWLQIIWNDRVDPSQRDIQIWTGSGGLRLWQEWGARYFNGSRTLRTPELTLGDTAAYGEGRRGKELNKEQWRTIYLDPFGSLTINYLPLLDNTVVNPVKDRYNLPLSSYQFLIMDYGLGQGPDSNILFLKQEGQEVYDYSCGTWTPAGPSNASNRGRFSHHGKEKAFTLIHDVKLGFLIKDVNLMAWFVPNKTR
jgi:hypothetical protein